MPVYFVYGFRWSREGWSGIRVHTIIHNLEDCSAEYLQNTNSRAEILDSFKQLYPELMQVLDTQGVMLDLIEQYDPEDTGSSDVVSQPYAFVAAKVVELPGQTAEQSETSANLSKAPTNAPLLSLNAEEIISKGAGLTTQASEAFTGLRDNIAAGEKIGWWIVYNGDPERAYDSDFDEQDVPDEEEALTPTVTSTSTATTPLSEKMAAPAMEASTNPSVPAKSSKSSFSSKLLPNRSKPEVIKPEAVLQSPKDEKIPEPTKLKEVAKSSGFRKKFFGKKI